MQSLRELGAPIPKGSQNTPQLQISRYAPAVAAFLSDLQVLLAK